MHVEYNNKRALKYLSPALILLGIFVFYPIIKTIILSFIGPDGSIGFSNYLYVYGTDAFQIALYNTTVYTIFVTVIEMIIALVIAYSLTQITKFKDLFQTIYFLPYVTSVIAIGSVFKIMYNEEYGIINQLFGLEVAWLSQEYALLSIIILGIWKGLAFNILIIFTGLSSIDSNLEKAAAVDGFSSVKTFVNIKLPQMKGILVYLLTINIIFNIKVYEEVVSLYGSDVAGPGGSANTIVYQLSNYITNDPKAAAALAVTLLVVVVLIRQVLVFIEKKTDKRSR